MLQLLTIFSRSGQNTGKIKGMHGLNSKFIQLLIFLQKPCDILIGDDLKKDLDDCLSDTFEPDIGETVEVEVRIALHFFLKWICNSMTDWQLL